MTRGILCDMEQVRAMILAGTWTVVAVFNTTEEKFVEKREITLVTFC